MVVCYDLTWFFCHISSAVNGRGSCRTGMICTIVTADDTPAFFFFSIVICSCFLLGIDDMVFRQVGCTYPDCLDCRVLLLYVAFLVGSVDTWCQVDSYWWCTGDTFIFGFVCVSRRVFFTCMSRHPFFLSMLCLFVVRSTYVFCVCACEEFVGVVRLTRP